MCGIVGYIGDKDVASVLLAGLWKLEYRGYDSCGIAVLNGGEIDLRKTTGRLMQLQELVDKTPISGNVGIGHTRWATHGEPTSINAHPHLDCKSKIAVVHNGIIENAYILRERLIKSRHIFKSNTDTEVIPHLIEENFQGNLLDAVIKSMKDLEGSFAIAVISADDPGKIVAARKGSPLIIGIGENENFIASDIPALAGHTKKIIILEEGQVSLITRNKVNVYNLDGKEIKKEPEKIDIAMEILDKKGYPHFMLKEIMEQPDVIRNNIKDKWTNNSINLGEKFKMSSSELANITRIIIQACGTSWHAGYVAKYLLEDIARIHTEIDISSEFRYRNPVVSGETLVVAVSQSGETADTLAGVREAKAKFLKILSFVNVRNSTIARESDNAIYINAGPEIGVASTKAYTAEIFSLYLFSLYLARIKWTLGDNIVEERINKLKELPDKMEKVLEEKRKIEKISEKYLPAKNFLFLGRGINYPSALEGALKLKEISYIHATGYPAGEMKHGPIALIDENTPVFAVVTHSSVYDKMISNLEEVKARKGKIIAIATEGDERIKEIAEDVIYIPDVDEEISPILTALPMQLFAYYIAAKKGYDVDKPRNLAKSVTVE